MWPLCYGHRNTTLSGGLVPEVFGGWLERRVALTCEGVRCRGQAGWLISTARLRTLLPLHLRPIDQVFYLEPSGRPCGCPGMPRVSGRASRLDAFSGYPFST